MLMYICCGTRTHSQAAEYWCTVLRTTAEWRMEWIQNNNRNATVRSGWWRIDNADGHAPINERRCRSPKTHNSGNARQADMQKELRDKNKKRGTSRAEIYREENAKRSWQWKWSSLTMAFNYLIAFAYALLCDAAVCAHSHLTLVLLKSNAHKNWRY